MERLKSFLKYPGLIVKSSSDEYQYLKAFIGLVIGILTTLCFHLLTAKGLFSSDKSQWFVTSIVGAFLCIGGVLTVEFRCIMLLMIPTFFGKSCRRLLIILAMSLIVKGPVQNIFVNLEETVKTFSCAGEMAINMTLNRLELVYQPVHDIARALVVAGHDIQSRMISISDGFYPLFLMMEDDRIISKRIEQLKSIPGMENFIEKLKNRYDSITNDINEKPSAKLSLKMRAHCMKLISGPIQVCSKIDDGVKSHFSNLGLKYEGSCPPEITSFCDDFEDVGEEFDEVYTSIKSLVKKMDEALNIDVEFDLKDLREMLDFKSVDRVRENVEDEIRYRSKVVDFFSKVFSRFLGFLFITIFISAAKYQKKYVTKIDHDNRYVTSYFEKIDKRREKKNKPGLLPLKRLERLELLHPMDFKLLPEEKRRMVLSFTRIFPNPLIAIVAFSLDGMFVYLLSLIAKHAHLNFQGKGEHEIYFEVHGDSFLANQWRSLFHQNSYKHQLEMNISSQGCLPKLSYLEMKYPVMVTGIYMLLFISSRLEAFGLRTRRFICSLCYYKREKIRVLWLYNSFLKRRIGSLEFAKQQKLNKFSKWNEIERSNKIMLLIRDACPKYFNWLRHFKGGKRECLLCQELETKTFVTCEICKNSYCEDCWQYLDLKCVPCNYVAMDADEYMRIDLVSKPKRKDRIKLN